MLRALFLKRLICRRAINKKTIILELAKYENTVTRLGAKCFAGYEHFILSAPYPGEMIAKYHEYLGFSASPFRKASFRIVLFGSNKLHQNVYANLMFMLILRVLSLTLIIQC